MLRSDSVVQILHLFPRGSLELLRTISTAARAFTDGVPGVVGTLRMASVSILADRDPTRTHITHSAELQDTTSPEGEQFHDFP